MSFSKLVITPFAIAMSSACVVSEFSRQLWIFMYGFSSSFDGLSAFTGTDCDLETAGAPCLLPLHAQLPLRFVVYFLNVSSIVCGVERVVAYALVARLP